jgi:hypothetical protein
MKFIMAVVILLGSGLLVFMFVYAMWRAFRERHDPVVRLARRRPLPLRSPSARAKAAAFTRKMNREAARRKAEREGN